MALFFAFAFAVMADPVSSVAYAIEAALRALDGHLELLLPTMSIVIGIIALVTLNYWQLVRMFPEGGGSPEAAGRAFGEEWSFLPIGALIVDFALTIAISIAAAGSALIAYIPGLAPERIPLAHGARRPCGRADLVRPWRPDGVRDDDEPLHRRQRRRTGRSAGSRRTPRHGHAPVTGSASPALVAVILAFPVAMALATGTEAPATSIAQLGQLDNRGRWRFGRGTLGLTILIVGGLTLGLTALAVHLHVGIPGSDDTQIAEPRQGRGRRRRPVRLLPALEQRLAAGGGGVLIPGWTGTAQGARTNLARRVAGPAPGTPCPSEPASHPRARGDRLRA